RAQALLERPAPARIRPLGDQLLERASHLVAALADRGPLVGGKARERAKDLRQLGLAAQIADPHVLDLMWGDRLQDRVLGLGRQAVEALDRLPGFDARGVSHRSAVYERRFRRDRAWRSSRRSATRGRWERAARGRPRRMRPARSRGARCARRPARTWSVARDRAPAAASPCPARARPRARRAPCGPRRARPARPGPRTGL